MRSAMSAVDGLIRVLYYLDSWTWAMLPVQLRSYSIVCCCVGMIPRVGIALLLYPRALGIKEAASALELLSR